MGGKLRHWTKSFAQGFSSSKQLMYNQDTHPPAAIGPTANVLLLLPACLSPTGSYAPAPTTVGVFLPPNRSSTAHENSQLLPTQMWGSLAFASSVGPYCLSQAPPQPPNISVFLVLLLIPPSHPQRGYFTKLLRLLVCLSVCLPACLSGHQTQVPEHAKHTLITCNFPLSLEFPLFLSP